MRQSRRLAPNPKFANRTASSIANFGIGAPARLDSRGGTTYVRRSRWHSPNASANSVPIDLSDQRLSRAPSTRKIMAKTKFRPLHDRVVVKRIDAEEKTKGGIIIPDTAKEKPQEGE